VAAALHSDPVLPLLPPPRSITGRPHRRDAAAAPCQYNDVTGTSL